MGESLGLPVCVCVKVVACRGLSRKYGADAFHTAWVAGSLCSGKKAQASSHRPAWSVQSTLLLTKKKNKTKQCQWKCREKLKVVIWGKLCTLTQIRTMVFICTGVSRVQRGAPFLEQLCAPFKCPGMWRVVLICVHFWQNTYEDKGERIYFKLWFKRFLSVTDNSIALGLSPRQNVS